MADRLFTEMEIDFETLPPRERYKLIVGGVVPRPIAFVTSMDTDGSVNAAPFSFFNAMCNDPPALAVGVNQADDSTLKDTASNILATGEYVINLVDGALADAMNLCETEFAPHVDELKAAGLTAVASTKVAPPRVGESPIAFECRLAETVKLAPGKYIFIGIVQHMFIRDDLYDAERNYVLAEKANLVARMHGAGWYARTTDLFEMNRLDRAEKTARFGKDDLVFRT